MWKVEFHAFRSIYFVFWVVKVEKSQHEHLVTDPT
jgi:hypothetical protein